MTFAEAFRDHVMPRLQRACRFHGLLVAAGIETWNDAQSEVARIAISRGALSVPAPLYDDLLTNWIPTQILAAADASEAAVAASRHVADVVARDLGRYWEAVNDAA